jgi:hypothetical protein
MESPTEEKSLILEHCVNCRVSGGEHSKYAIGRMQKIKLKNFTKTLKSLSAEGQVTKTEILFHVVLYWHGFHMLVSSLCLC